MLAAWLAGRGLGGPADPLGPGGVLETLAGGAGGVHRGALDQASWELELNTFKTYPCGVVAHPAMDAGVDAHPLIGDPSLITGVSVTCNPLVPELMGLRHPEDGLRSRFSARHGVAAGLRYGRAGLAEFSDAAARDPEMTRLREVIELDPDPACARDAAVLRVSLSSGEPVTVRAEHTRGSVARPLTDDQLLEKVSALVAPVLGPRAVTRIRAVVEGLPAAPDLTALLGAIRPAAAPPAATRPAPSPAPGPAPVAAAADRAPATDVILALALASPALVDAVVLADQAGGEAKASLASFRAAVESGAGTRVEQLIESAAEGGVLPEGHGLTAFASAAAALAAGPAAGAGPGGAVLAAGAIIVCAAATATGQDCAEAVAIGLDVTELVATGLPDASGQGWSVPVIAATIGAAVAAGLMLGLPEPALRAAIGIAATQAAGLRSADGTDAFVVQAGKAAFNAVQAAHLAAAGFTSSAQPLEGRRGLYALFGG
jgi:2-methylcitrate dehydratase PrpD